MEHRAALVVGSHSEAIELCSRLERGETAARLFSGRSRNRPQLTFNFDSFDLSPHQLNELYDGYPEFRAAVNEYDQLSQAEFNRSLFPGLLTQSLLEKPVEQFAVILGLARLWRNWGIVPDVVAGRDVGEFAAGTIAGLFCWMDGLRWLARCQTSRIDFDSFVETVDLRPANLSFVHKRAGTFVAAGQRLDPTGTKNATLSSSPSPDVGSVVLKLGQSSFAPSSVQESTASTFAFSPMAGNSVTAELVGMLAQLYVWGYTPDFAAIDSPWSRQKLSLPNYPFQRRRHWFDGHASPRTPPSRPIEVNLSTGQSVMHQQDSADSLRFLVDHHIYDTMVVPGCAFWPRYFNCAV